MIQWVILSFIVGLISPIISTEITKKIIHYNKSKWFNYYLTDIQIKPPQISLISNDNRKIQVKIFD